MGYNCQLTASIYMPKEKFGAFCAAVCKETKNREDSEGSEECVADILNEYGFDAEFDDAGNLVGMVQNGEKLVDQAQLLDMMAPFLRPGSYISGIGEDGLLWRWVVVGGEVKEERGKVIYESGSGSSATPDSDTDDDKNGNENCLWGMECPSCGNSTRLRIVGTALFDVTDDGTDNPTDVEWSDDSAAYCPECRFTGKLREFEFERKVYEMEYAAQCRKESLKGEGEEEKEEEEEEEKGRKEEKGRSGTEGPTCFFNPERSCSGCMAYRNRGCMVLDFAEAYGEKMAAESDVLKNMSDLHSEVGPLVKGIMSMLNNALPSLEHLLQKGLAGLEESLD